MILIGGIKIPKISKKYLYQGEIPYVAELFKLYDIYSVISAKGTPQIKISAICVRKKLNTMDIINNELASHFFSVRMRIPIPIGKKQVWILSPIAIPKKSPENIIFFK